MQVVGLTGGIGSGKSTVAAMLSELGAVVIDADRLAREVVSVGSPGLQQVVRRFGPDVLDAEGALDRKGLGRKVFKDAAARRDLEAIIHPRVAALSQARIQAALEAGAPLVVYDVPLLYENKLDAGLPAVVVVRVSPAVQRSRVAGRDGLPEDEIEDRIAAQMPLADKVARAQYVIDNDGPVEETRVQVEALFTRLTQEIRP